MRQLIVIGALASMIVLAGAPSARAHALLSGSQPPDGAQLATAPASVTLTFTEPTDPSLSVVHVLDTRGAQREEGAPARVAGDTKSLRVVVGELGKGVFTVTWRTVSRVDGHVTAGAFAFGVGEPVGEKKLPATVTPRPTVVSVVSRFLFYAGLFLLIGAALCALVLYGVATAGAQLARTGITLAVLGVIGIAEEQWHASGASFGVFARSALGTQIAWRAAPLVLLIALFAATRVRARWTIGVGGIAAACSFLAHVAAGHAGAGRARWVFIAVQWVHVIAAGVWIGGLVGLMAGVRTASPETRARAVRRFSTLAFYLLFTVLGSGLARSASEVGSWRHLTDTSFGRVVIAKFVLLLVLAGLGAINRYRSAPQVSGSISLLEHVSRAEVMAAIAVLALSGILSGVTPGATLLAQAKDVSKLVVTGADFGTTVRVHLEISPGFAGRNSYALRLRDYDSGAPVDAERVSLRFLFLERAGIGDATAQLVEKTPGTYAGVGTELSLDGRWRVTVVVERGVNSVEIPLALMTKSTPQQIKVIPGTPTLYDITLSPSRSVQMYVDPGKTGQNELHATFFQGGTGFPGLTDVTLSAGRGSDTPEQLPLRTLDVGHVVATVTLAPGGWRFSVRARAPSGELLSAYFDATIR